MKYSRCAAGVMLSFLFMSSANALEIGFYERVRHEFRRNIADFEDNTKDNRNFFRIKTSVSGLQKFGDDVSVFLRLTNENYPYAYWAGAYAPRNKSASKKGFRYEVDEIVFDNLYVDLKNFLGAPVDLRLGRQDLVDYGEGFLIKDGTPPDQTRTSYFNAAKTTWRVDKSNAIEFIYIKDARTDELLPVINELKPPQALTSSDEAAYVLYHKHDGFIKDLHLENYYILKKEEASPSATARMTRKETELNTLGSYLKYKFSPWALRTQWAGQFGSYGTDDRTGLGGYAFLERDLKGLWSPQAVLGFVYLSGDNRDTSKNEAWDPLFARWPWISDLYGLYYGSETEVYYVNNLQLYQAALNFKPTKKTKLSLRYNFLRANESVAATATLFSGSGYNRGHLYQARFDYFINKNMSFYTWFEYFVPGDFYVKTADDAFFCKTEFQIKF